MIREAAEINFLVELGRLSKKTGARQSTIHAVSVGVLMGFLTVEQLAEALDKISDEIEKEPCL